MEAIMTIWPQSLWAYPTNCTANESQSEYLVNEKKKVLIFLPTRWVSSPNYTLGTVHYNDHNGV